MRVLAATLLAFATLALLVVSEIAHGVDQTVAGELYSRTPGVWSSITRLGQTTFIWGLVAVTLAGLVARRRVREAAFLGLSTAGAPLVTASAKAVFAQPRPVWPDPVTTAQGYAFPSGHTLAATVVWGALALVAAQHLRGSGRTIVLVAAGGVAVLVGVSRMVIGVHWLSDVAGGWLLGGAWLAGCALVTRLGARGPVRPAACVA